MIGMFFFYSHKLVNGVKYLFLDPGPSIQLFLGNNPADKPVHPLCSFIPVSHRVSKDLIVPVQKHKIHSPGVNPHTHRYLPGLSTLFKTNLDLLKQLFQVPAGFPVFYGQSVIETVHLLHHHAALLHMSQNVTAAGRADIHRQIIFCHDFRPPYILILSEKRIKKKYTVCIIL